MCRRRRGRQRPKYIRKQFTAISYQNIVKSYPFSRELRELGEREGQEIFRLTTEVQLARENAQHHECFIEDLSGHQLFEKLFEDDLFKDSRAKELSTR